MLQGCGHSGILHGLPHSSRAQQTVQRPSVARSLADQLGETDWRVWPTVKAMAWLQFDLSHLRSKRSGRLYLRGVAGLEGNAFQHHD